jgi:hypothetical protein
MAKGEKKKHKRDRQGGEDEFAGARPFCIAPLASFTVRSFRVHWISADPGYDPRYRLTPIINLFESESAERHEGAVAFLQFRLGRDLGGASHDEGSTVYRLDYPIEMADSVLTLLGSGAPLEVAYFEQDDRKWADLRTPFLEVGDDEDECDLDEDCEEEGKVNGDDPEGHREE